MTSGAGAADQAGPCGDLAVIHGATGVRTRLPGIPGMAVHDSTCNANAYANNASIRASNIRPSA